MAISISPDSYESYNSIGEFFLVYGDKEKARISFLKVQELRPGDPGAAYVLENLDQIYNDMHPVTKN